MTTDLDEACADLAAWLPALTHLTTQPDTTGTPGDFQPRSDPPWNTQAANALFDIREWARRLETITRWHVTGTLARRGSSDANTTAALRQAARFLDAIPVRHHDRDPADTRPCGCGHCQAARQAARLLGAVLALAAIDLAERIRTIPRACPYCKSGILRVLMSCDSRPGEEGRVTCLNTACFDGDGQHPRGVICQSRLDAVWRVYWNDGAVT